MPEILLTVEEAASERLDKFIASHAPESSLTRSQLKSSALCVLLNEKPAKLSSKVKQGDTVRVAWELPPITVEPEEIPLAVLFENSDVTVVDKAQGMVTHPGAGNRCGTLVNALLFHWGKSVEQQTDADDDFHQNVRSGIVHRLDKDTSGVIIAAKNQEAHLWLTEQFANRRVKKEYIALVAGRPPQRCGKIITRIRRDPRNRKRFTALDEKHGGESRAGKRAWTVYHCVACYGQFSLMRLRLKTGRTHQIRVHMKHIGCPVLGDSIYGSHNKIFPDATLMLHARLLSLRLPGQSEFTTFVSPVPDRFKKTIRELAARFTRCELA